MDAAGVKLDSHNLRDLLRIRDEDFHNNLNHTSSSSAGGSGTGRPHGLTLLAVLTDNGGPSPRRSTVESTRTLLDVIREDQIGGARRDGRRSWRQLKDKIRLRHRDRDNHRMVIMTRRAGGSARFSSVDHTGESSHSAIPNVAVPNLRANSGAGRGRAGPTLEPAGQLARRQSVAEVIEHRAAASASAAEQPVRMSLMALLEENDLQLGWEDSTRTMFDDGVEIDEEPENFITASSAAGYNNCCVCMVRHKGAAFIPCGHTFCRLCSRELWVQRGNCPLCNNYILEILDIF